MQESDEALVSRVLALDDRDAFATLVKRHQQRIYYLLRRFARDPALAEDLCQNTFLRAWERLASFSGSGRFAAWLGKLAYNEFLQHLRQRRRSPEADPLSLDDPSVPPALAPGESGASADLERLLAVLRPDEQHLLLLSYAHGLTIAEIAEVVDQPPGTIKSQIHRAKQKIREHFAIEVPA
ncbi:MAG: sigma-70 family RNA polymerase sigma factor [Pseudomonadales bacterium]